MQAMSGFLANLVRQFRPFSGERWCITGPFESTMQACDFLPAWGFSRQ